MRLPLFAKDSIKEALMSVLPVPDVETSKRLGQAAMAAMYSLAAVAPSGGVLESNFRAASVNELQSLPGTVVEIFCRCDRELALARYRARSSTRHPGHFDSLRTDDELWNTEVTSPVCGGWPYLEVDTSHPVDVSELIVRLRYVVGTT